MPAATKHPISRARNIAELNALADDIPRMTDARKFLKTAEQVFKKADEFNLSGDEESAYIMYMRYFNIISAIKTSPDYKKNEKFFRDMIGVRHSQRAIQEAETLSESLKNRYEEKEAEEVSKKFEALHITGEKKKELEDAKSKKEHAERDENAKNVTNSAGVDPDNTARNGKPKSRLALSVQELYALLKGPESVLIMDVRPEDQFTASRINHRHCINVPSEILPPGSTVNYIEKALPKESRALWEVRDTMAHLVMLDWSCSESSLIIGTTLASLKDAIWKWDRYTKLKSEPLVLSGGYNEWLNYYPTLSTNANITRPSIVSEDPSQEYSLDNITYEFDQAFLETPEKDEKPNLDQLKLEVAGGDEDRQGLVPVPSIDRSLKPSADLNNSRVQQPSSTVVRGNTAPSTHNNRTSSSLDMIKNQFKKELNEDSFSKNVLGTNEKVSNAKPTVPTGVSTHAPKLAPKVNNIPNVNRTLKPMLGSAEGSALARAEYEAAQQARVASQQRYDSYKAETRGLVEERRARIAALETEEHKLEGIQKLKRKELAETAEVMRLKRKIQSEVNELEMEKQRVETEGRVREEEVKKLLEEEKEKLSVREEAERLRALKKRANHEPGSLSRTDDTPTHQVVEPNISPDEDGSAYIEDDVREVKERELREVERQEKERREIARREKKQRRQDELEEQERRMAEEETRERVEREKVAREQRQEGERNAEIKRLDRERTEREWIDRENRLAANREGGTPLSRHQNRHPITGTFTPPGSPRPTFTHASHMGTPASRTGTPASRMGTPPTRAAATGIIPGLSPITPDNRGLYKARLRDEDDVPRSVGMRRSHSSPNIAQLVQDDERPEPLQPTFPNVDRGSKPRSPRPERQMLPAKSEVSAAKVRNLQPTWGNVGRGLTGLRNLGNTCYMNSTIQCLSNTSFLTTYFLTDNYRHDINRDNMLGKKGEVAEEFAVLIKALWMGQYRSVNPRDFKGVISKHHSLFAGYDQQDSQEMLLFLLDCLHEDMNKVKKRPSRLEQENDGIPDRIAGERAWLNHKQFNNSIIVDLFQGQFMSTVTCMKCDKTSTKFDTFMYLTVPIPSNTRCSLRDCLTHFAKEEKMTGDSQWSCPRCKCRRDARKRIVIYRLPRILLIHLKRFYYQGMWRQKINAAVDFQLDNLDLNKYVEGPEKQNPYNLYAVSNHYGTMEGGHYTAFCKSPSSSRWSKYDDHEVYDLSRADIKSSAAYILYYTSITQDLKFVS